MTQSNVTGPNNSNVVTGSVFCNLYEEKYTAVIHGEASVILSYWLFVTFLPEKLPVVLVTVSGNLCRNKSPRQPSRPRLQWTFPQKTASLPMSDSQTGSSVYWWWLCNYVIQSKTGNIFQDAWWVRISITSLYNGIHMIINSEQVHF